MLRRLLHASYEIQARVHSHEASPRELVDLAERSILEVAHEDRRKDFRAIHDLLSTELDKLEQLSAEGLSVTGTPSGFEDLDRITGGFQAGNLIILAARPGMGKCLAGSSLVYDPATGGASAHRRGRRRRGAGRGRRGRGGRPGPQAPAGARERRTAQRRPAALPPHDSAGPPAGRNRQPSPAHARGLAEGVRARDRGADRRAAAAAAPDRDHVDARSRGRAAGCADRRRQPHRADAAVLLRRRLGDPAGRRAGGERARADGPRRWRRDRDHKRGTRRPAQPAHRDAAAPRLWGLRSGEKFVPETVFAPRRGADRPLPLGALCLRRARVLVRAVLADRLHDDQRAARA